MAVEVTGPMHERYDEILSERALALVEQLHRALNPRRLELLERRRARVEEIAAGGSLGFLAETAAVRDDPDWRVAEPAPGLVDRRVEITGPTDQKMTINALNSGAKVWLADHEDANTPLWENVIGGQLNLLDAITRKIDFTSDAGKSYALKPDDELATIVVRPRGWHLPEKHLLVDGERTSGALVDFALYLTACGQLQLDRGQGPYFYLPKMESHLEARLWNDAFVLAQEFLGIPRGTIRATVLIETYPAAFEMEEILYELREHSAGLNAGRWDFMFSVIKTYRDPRRRLPAAGPQLRDDDRAVHAGVHRAAGPDVPQARRARDRRDGGVHPEQGPGGERAGLREGRGRQDPRGRRRLRRLVGRAPRHGRHLPRGLRQGPRSSPNQLDKLRDDVTSPPTSSSTSPPPPARSPRPACATTSASPSSTSRPGSRAPAPSASST